MEAKTLLYAFNKMIFQYWILKYYLHKCKNIYKYLQIVFDNDRYGCIVQVESDREVVLREYGESRGGGFR